jgi:PPK2 family polyphosphate:nucleotide phosphotransferase
MKLERVLHTAGLLSRPYRIVRGADFRLSRVDPTDSGPFHPDDPSPAREALSDGVEALAELQERLYAQDRWAVLVLFQGMDASGKDSAIKHVLSGVNPQGCQVYSFQAPSREELDHDYLWRCAKALPERGRIGIFNRSYYEETVVVRVHPEKLAAQKLPPRLVTRSLWAQRFEDIRGFERYLARNGIALCKVFLHVSKGEQKKRFLERLDRPEKHWKFRPADIEERRLWDRYRKAYQETIRRTAAPHAPWYVVPADRKWYTRIVVACALLCTLQALDLHYPRVTKGRRAELAAARRRLLRAD